MHDDIGFNYRLPNISAALGLGRLKILKMSLKKRENFTIDTKKILRK